MRRKSGTVLMIALMASMLLVGLMMVVAILDPIEIEVVYANEIETTEQKLIQQRFLMKKEKRFSQK